MTAITFPERPAACPACGDTNSGGNVFAYRHWGFDCGTRVRFTGTEWIIFDDGCRNAFAAAVTARAWLDELVNHVADVEHAAHASDETLARVRALLPKWGAVQKANRTFRMTGFHNGIDQAIGNCFNDLSAALRPPETVEQAAEQLTGDEI